MLEARAGVAPETVFPAVVELADTTPERLASLPGDFGFIRFRPHGEATVVRSCGGLVPFYWHQAEGRIAFSTRIGDFVRYLPEELQLDALVNAIWAYGLSVFPDRRTFFAGVRVLDRGSYLQVERGGKFRIGRYWNPRPERVSPPTEARAREHAERLRSLLVEKLTRELDPSGGNLLSLSGGVDSTSLAALTCGVVGREISTFSILPLSEHHFEHEMSYIRPILERFRIERSWLYRMRPESRRELSAEEVPHVFYVLHPTLLSLPRIQRETRISVLFGGDFADEVCGSIKSLPDWVMHTSLLALIKDARNLPTGKRDFLRWVKHRALSALRRPMLPHPDDLPELFHAKVREEYREWLARRRREAARDRDAHRFLATSIERAEFIISNWEATSFLGIRRSFPFLNREVLELAFECHPVEFLGPGTKKLLRAALHNDVPQKNLYRADKGGWGQYLLEKPLSWSASLPENLKLLVREDWFPQPPAALDYSNTCTLDKLMVFGDAVQMRRRARESHYPVML